MASHREVVRRYDVDEDAVLPVLDVLKQVASVESGARVLSAEHVDTADLALARARIGLSRRTGGDDDGWHLDLPARSAHHEVRRPLGRSATVPKPLRDIVWLPLRGQGTATVATLHTHRAEHRLIDRDGTTLALVCEDVVTAESAGPLQTWREWTVQLVDGDTSLAEMIDRVVRDEGAREARASSAVERALADRLPEIVPTPSPGHRKKDSAAHLVQARLVGQVQDLVNGDLLVRAGAPDGVHEMRVAIRRLRSNLATFRPALDREVTDPLRAELQWLGQALGDLRDIEVQGEHLSRCLDALVEAGSLELVRGPVRSRLRSYARAEQKRARTAVLDAMVSPRYLALVDRLEALTSSPPWSPRADSSVHKLLAPRVRRDLQRLVDEGSAALADDRGPSHDERLHDVRKATKRARYAAEPLVAAYGKDAARLVTTTKRLQAVLGDHHDTVAARRWLRDLADQASRSGESAFTYGVLHEREHERASRLEAEFAAAWRRLPTKKLVRWLE